MKRQQSPPAVLTKAVRFDTLNVRVYDEARRLSLMLTRGQARDVLAAVLRHLYRASGGQPATAEITTAQGALAHELQLSRNWLGVLRTRLQQTDGSCSKVPVGQQHAFAQDRNCCGWNACWGRTRLWEFTQVDNYT